MEHNNTKKNGQYGFALFLIGCLFFIFGFITWSNSQLIPYLKLACELSITQSYYVATAFFAAYFVMAIPSSMVLKWTGFKKGMSLGLLVMAIGAALFIPAAQTRNYSLFLTGLFIIGTGLALLQTASNPYVTVLGPMDSAAKRMSIMGICNKVAGILAVYVLGSITLSNADELKASLNGMSTIEKNAALSELASRVIVPYAVIALILLILAVILYFIHLPEVHEEEENVAATAVQKSSLFQYPHLILGAIAIFFYVGVEVISYDTFTGFGESLGYSTVIAKNFASYTGYGLLVGYLLSIFAIPKYISQRKALIIAILLSMALVLGAIYTEGTTAVLCFALLGFSNSVMWPAIWPLALDGVGRFTKIGGALLIMGIVGGAVLPPLYGAFAEWLHTQELSTQTHQQVAYWIMIPCYLYLLYFALKGYKAGKD